jgi:hypothetical protein
MFMIWDEYHPHCLKRASLVGMRGAPASNCGAGGAAMASLSAISFVSGKQLQALQGRKIAVVDVRFRISLFAVLPPFSFYFLVGSVAASGAW